MWRTLKDKETLVFILLEHGFSPAHVQVLQKTTKDPEKFPGYCYLCTFLLRFWHGIIKKFKYPCIKGIKGACMLWKKCAMCEHMAHFRACDVWLHFCTLFWTKGQKCHFFVLKTILERPYPVLEHPFLLEDAFFLFKNILLCYRTP